MGLCYFCRRRVGPVGPSQGRHIRHVAPESRLRGEGEKKIRRPVVNKCGGAFLLPGPAYPKSMRAVPSAAMPAHCLSLDRVLVELWDEVGVAGLDCGLGEAALFI